MVETVYKAAPIPQWGPAAFTTAPTTRRRAILLTRMRRPAPLLSSRGAAETMEGKSVV